MELSDNDYGSDKDDEDFNIDQHREDIDSDDSYETFDENVSPCDSFKTRVSSP